MGKKQRKPEQSGIKSGVWGEAEITRSQVFASGTVQKWLELADKAFGLDAKNPPAEDSTDETAEAAADRRALKRAKSA